MSRQIIAFISTLGLALSLATPTSAVAADPNTRTVPEVTAEDPFPGATEGIFLVRLDDPPLATYRGGLAGLEATSPMVTGDQKLDAETPESIAYAQYLEAGQAEFVARMEDTLGHSADVRFTYTNSDNGLAVWLTPAEAAQVRQLPGVSFMKPDEVRQLHTDTGPGWIGAPDIWGGTDCSGPGSCGEGIVVGIIDTGINPSNPSFADVGGDGYDHSNPRGAGNYVGVCDPGNGGAGDIKPYDATFPCNDKLIGAWGFVSVDTIQAANSPLDYNGHGSHTASTAAGNFVEATIGGEARSPEPLDISGVAPHANIIVYAGCCAESALAASIDQAIADDVDVINYSIGGTAPSDPWSDFDAVGFLAAREAGIFVAVSAGNEGPAAASIASPADAPWLTAVGASTHSRTWANDVDLSGGPGAPATISGAAFTDGYGPAPIVYAGDYGNALCSFPFSAGTWTNDEIVVCDRGEVSRVSKGVNAAAGGAGGLILANAESNGLSINADPHAIPASHITYPDGVVLKAWLEGGASHMATISAGAYVQDPTRGNTLAEFTSRGENPAVDIVSPSLVAPGVEIIAAGGQDDAIAWDFSNGTSMASPHVAGAAALLMQEHPTWTPAEIQSAIMLTANTGVVDHDEISPAGPFDTGSGVVALDDANNSGLIMSETNARYLAADPAAGGDPKTLNLASMADGACVAACSWERTVTATTGGTWTVGTTAAGGVALAVTPTSFTLAAGESQTITIAADVTGAAAEVWAFGEVRLTAPGLPDSHLPVAVRPSAAPDAAPPAGFIDDDLSIFEEDIEWLQSAGITRGCNPPLNDRYCPEDPLTRGQLAAMLNRAFELPPATADFFADDDDSVFESDIDAVAAAGITLGCNPPDNDRYCPDDLITRGQTAAMFDRALRLPATASDFFTDDNTSIFEGSINRLAVASITRGCNPPDNDKYCPDALVTRGQIAAFFRRALS